MVQLITNEIKHQIIIHVCIKGALYNIIIIIMRSGDSPQNLLYTNIWTMTNNDCRADACDNTLSLGPGSICAIGIEGGKCTGDNAARDSCYVCVG